MIKNFIILLICLVHTCAFAADYTVYVDNDISDTNTASATPDCTNYNPTTGACSGGSDSAFKTIADVDAFVDSLNNGTDTAIVYWQRDDKWTMTGNSNRISIDVSDVTFDAYGSGDRPFISGGYNYPNTIYAFVITIGDDSAGNIDNVWIKNIEIGEVHNGVTTADRGGGIFFAGTQSDGGGNYTGGGGVEGCKISETGRAAITLYRLPNVSGAVLIENNDLSYANRVDEVDGLVGWPQVVNTNDSYTYGHEIRYNWIHDSYGEGIGCRGFDIVEYNVVGNTHAANFYIGNAANSGAVFSTILRYNLGYAYGSKWHAATGIGCNDEKTAGDNSAIHDKIYGNTIIGAYQGIQLKNQAQTSAIGRVDVFQNTFIDCRQNINFAHTDYFTIVNFKNNASIINTDAEATCQHFGSFAVNGWTGWDIGPNFFSGDIAPASPMNTDAVYGDADIGKESAWSSASSVADLNDFSPQSTSDMLNNTNTDNSIGAEFDDQITGGEFNVLPDTENLSLTQQSTPWTFGAIGEAGSVTPTISGLGTVGAVACNADPETVSQVCQTNVPAVCKWDPTDTTFALMANTYNTADNLSFTDTFSADCGDSGTHYTICQNLYDSGAESASSSNAWSVNSPPFPGAVGGGGVIQLGSGSRNIELGSGSRNIDLE